MWVWEMEPHLGGATTTTTTTTTTFDGSDWSPRISFSHNVATTTTTIKKNPQSPPNLEVHSTTNSGSTTSSTNGAALCPNSDHGFEFSSCTSPHGLSFSPNKTMVFAEELFCDGKLRPLAPPPPPPPPETSGWPPLP